MSNELIFPVIQQIESAKYEHLCSVRKGISPIHINQKNNQYMLRWTITFIVLALIAGVLGFGGIAAGAAGIAKVLFFIFIILFIISLLRGKKVF